MTKLDMIYKGNLYTKIGKIQAIKELKANKSRELKDLSLILIVGDKANINDLDSNLIPCVCISKYSDFEKTCNHYQYYNSPYIKNVLHYYKYLGKA